MVMPVLKWYHYLALLLECQKSSAGIYIMSMSGTRTIYLSILRTHPSPNCCVTFPLKLKHLHVSSIRFAVSVWQRFVTMFREDQDMINNHFASQQSSGQGRPFRPIVSNYTGNPQAVITHPKGDAQQYERCCSCIVLLQLAV